jgi:hypothetical protein
MLPAWLYTLGSILMREAEIVIPFPLLIMNLAVVLLPCLLGFIISCYKPQIRVFVNKIKKSFTLCMFVMFLLIIFVSKFYALKFIEWKYFFAGKSFTNFLNSYKPFKN